MEKFFWNLAILQYCGFWQPKPNFAKSLYKIYTWLIITFSYGLCIMKIIRLLRTGIDSLEEFSSKTLLIPELAGSYVKAINIYLQQTKIERLLDIFNNDYCKPNDRVEVQVQREYDKECRSVLKKKIFCVKFE